MVAKTKSKSKKQIAPPGILNIAFIWDMSGTMGIVHEATRAGTHEYLSDLQKEEGKLASQHGEGIFTRLSLTAFDTVFEKWAVDEPISNVNIGQIVAGYQPRGRTALYDAIANTITDLDSRLKGKRSGEKCLVVVMTDGHENASQEYGGVQGKKRIFDLIKAYEAKGNWTFVYLGANVDAYAEASAIGIPAGNTAYYSSTPDSVRGVTASVSSVTSTRRRSASGQSVSSFADAGEIQDYRDESSSSSRIWTPGEKKFSDSGDARKRTRKAR